MTGYLWRGRPGLGEMSARIMASRSASPGGRGPAGLAAGHGTEAGARRHWRAAALAQARESVRAVRGGSRGSESAVCRLD